MDKQVILQNYFRNITVLLIFLLSSHSQATDTKVPITNESYECALFGAPLAIKKIERSKRDLVPDKAEFSKRRSLIFKFHRDEPKQVLEEKHQMIGMVPFTYVPIYDVYLHRTQSSFKKVGVMSFHKEFNLIYAAFFKNIHFSFDREHFPDQDQLNEFRTQLRQALLIFLNQAQLPTLFIMDHTDSYTCASLLREVVSEHDLAKKIKEVYVANVFPRPQSLLKSKL